MKSVARSICAALLASCAVIGTASAGPQEDTGPKPFSPIVAATLIDTVCRAAEGDGKGVPSFAETAGLAPHGLAPTYLSWALPEGTQTWAAEALDGEVYLYGYGETPLKCGVSIVRPIPGVTSQLVIEQLAKSARAFAVDSTQDVGGGVIFTRLKSADGRFIDMMDYPRNGDAPGVLKVELLR